MLYQPVMRFVQSASGMGIVIIPRLQCANVKKAFRMYLWDALTGRLVVVFSGNGREQSTHTRNHSSNCTS